MLEVSNQTDPEAAAPIDAATWRLCWVIVFGAFASGLDASVVNVGLNRITTQLHTNLGMAQWVATSYILALALSLPLAGWLTRRFGPGQVWLAALGLFTITSGMCALSPTISALLMMRIAQGLAGGVLIPAGQTILAQAVGPEHLGRVMGTLGIAVSAAPTIGPLLGGLILNQASWPWLFAINLPIGILGLALGWYRAPRSTPQRGIPLDITGLILISAALPLIVLAVTTWGDAAHISAVVLIQGAAGVSALTLFVRCALRHKHPVLNLHLYRIPAYRAGSLSALCSGAMVFASGIVQTLYFQTGRHQDTLHTGLSLIGAASATALTAPLAGSWIDRYGPARVSSWGFALPLATTLPFTILPVDVPMWIIQGLLIGYGTAVALVAMPATVAAYQAIPAPDMPDAVTQVNVLQRVGGSIGGAVCAVLIASHLPHTTTAFHAAFTVLRLAALGTLTAAVLIHRTTRGDRREGLLHG